MARTHPLGADFMVVATQNPIEQQGTYPLPEAQLDRFLFKHVMTIRRGTRSARSSPATATASPCPIPPISASSRSPICRS